MGDLAAFAVEHGTSLVALAAGVTAMVRARARKDTASAEAVEQLTEEHAKCTKALEELETRVGDVETKAKAAEKKATDNEKLAVQLNEELNELRREIQR